MHNPPDRRVLDLLRKYDTPTICNVVELFDIRPRNEGYLDHTIQAVFPKLPPMVGFASTATFRSASPPVGGKPYAGLVEQIESFAHMPGPVVVVFQDLDEPAAAATFGEVMCTTYQRFGAVGLITSGAGRDLDQVERLNFPVFTNGTICAHGYCHIPQINIPVRVGGVRIQPGDLLHGDRNGVTTIPLQIAADVADACAEYMAAEAVVLDYLKSSHVTPAGYAAAQRECQRQIEALAARLRKRS
ncbi:MAG: RraA family protein [Gemmatales bacterium]|nr:RraA family protein [Gemmatales bacterium]MDW8386176.1 RraA family protein [Gemmatales bacterium]